MNNYIDLMLPSGTMWCPRVLNNSITLQNLGMRPNRKDWAELKRYCKVVGTSSGEWFYQGKNGNILKCIDHKNMCYYFVKYK